jgi:hypothetical protein
MPALYVQQSRALLYAQVSHAASGRRPEGAIWRRPRQRVRRCAYAAAAAAAPRSLRRSLSCSISGGSGALKPPRPWQGLRARRHTARWRRSSPPRRIHASAAAEHTPAPPQSTRRRRRSPHAGAAAVLLSAGAPDAGTECARRASAAGLRDSRAVPGRECARRASRLVSLRKASRLVSLRRASRLVSLRRASRLVSLRRTSGLVSLCISKRPLSSRRRRNARLLWKEMKEHISFMLKRTSPSCPVGRRGRKTIKMAVKTQGGGGTAHSSIIGSPAFKPSAISCGSERRGRRDSMLDHDLYHVCRALSAASNNLVSP